LKRQTTVNIGSEDSRRVHLKLTFCEKGTLQTKEKKLPVFGGMGRGERGWERNLEKKGKSRGETHFGQGRSSNKRSVPH